MIHKRVETAGVYPLVRPRGVSALPAILLFGGVMGFAGMVVGVPLFAVLYSMLTDKINHLLKKRGLSVDTNDYRGHKRIDPETHAFVEAQETMPPVSAKERRRAAQQKDQENKKQ